MEPSNLGRQLKMLFYLFIFIIGFYGVFHIDNQLFRNYLPKLKFSPMSNCKSLFFSLLTLVCFQTLTAQTARRAGINLTGVDDYSTELVFTDAFKQCREWTVHDLEPGGDWDTGVAIPLSEIGRAHV